MYQVLLFKFRRHLCKGSILPSEIKTEFRWKDFYLNLVRVFHVHLELSRIPKTILLFFSVDEYYINLAKAKSGSPGPA